MEVKKVLEELRSEIAAVLLERYDASHHEAFEVSGVIDDIIQKKICQYDGD